jgi:DNA topoisomerase-3
LFRRKYIERKKKLVLPTQTGIDLINIIDNELLKSAELTGRWEKRLKEIERGEFNAGTFINNMKKMVDELVYEVRSNSSKKRISSNVISNEVKQSVNNKKITSSSSSRKNKKQVSGKTCPKCKKGKLLKGSSAFGCSEYKSNCDLKISFEIYGKKISENQIIRLIDKGCTTNLKGFIVNDKKVEGLVRFDDSFSLKLESKKSVNSGEIASSKNSNGNEKIPCPKCEKGTILKGKTAYGCSNYKKSCDFIFTFENIKKTANGKPLTKELVLEIINT